MLTLRFKHKQKSLTMKKTLIILFAAAALTACSGSDDTTSSTSTTTTLDVSNTSFEWNTNVRQQALKISANGNWKISSNVKWCSPMKASGTGNYNLALWVDPNITTSSRSGKLTLTSNDKTQTITLSQPAYSSDTDYVYRIPLVFHVLYNNENDTIQYVFKKWMAAVVKVVNIYYEMNHANIKFEMAKIDEKGDTLEEPGVMRHKIDVSTIDEEAFLTSSNYMTYGKYAAYAQNLKRYLNVYIFNFKDENTMGISDTGILPKAYPLAGLNSTDAANDSTHLPFPFGCCINNKYIYETENDGYYNPVFIVTTMAHELGHYLGLLHAFNEDNDCADTDYCTDTYSCDYNLYINNLDKLLNSPNITFDSICTRTTCDGTNYIAKNIMDYEFCYSDTLTPQQLTRTKRVLNYGSLIPGPKLVDVTALAKTRTAEAFKPQIHICPPVIIKRGDKNMSRGSNLPKVLLH